MAARKAANRAGVSARAVVVEPLIPAKLLGLLVVAMSRLTCAVRVVLVARMDPAIQARRGVLMVKAYRWRGKAALVERRLEASIGLARSGKTDRSSRLF